MKSSAAKGLKRGSPPTNEQLAATLEEVADLLEMQGANPFRVRAYRGAAQTIRKLNRPVDRIVQGEGITGLVRLPGIGQSLARAIEKRARTGHLPLLERLRGEDDVERIFATVANIGPGLAHRIHEHLGIESLAELEAAANDGRLGHVPGMGRKRICAVRESLAGRFQRRRVQAEVPRGPDVNRQVGVEELLDVDDEYLCLAEQQKFPRIAPRRFNPTGEAWLPVLHTQRSDRHYTAIFSNTARAHEMGTTHDWVVIYRDDDRNDGRWTVITANYGKLRGRRIIRGREDECATFYSKNAEAPPKRPI